ncbi:MAG: CoA transferase, partial [Acidimicrobiales bacterium]
VHFLEPVLLDRAVNGVTWPAMGHRSPYADPQGVFATNETERYVAVACETDEQRRRLDTVLGPGGDRHDRLAEWTARLPATEAVAELVDAGVPASMVARPTDLRSDPQLDHRRFFVDLDHPTLGRTSFDGPATAFSATPPMLFESGPTIGQHTREVLTDLLGFQATEVAAFETAQVLR